MFFPKSDKFFGYFNFFFTLRLLINIIIKTKKARTVFKISSSDQISIIIEYYFIHMFDID